MSEKKFMDQRVKQGFQIKATAFCWSKKIAIISQIYKFLSQVVFTRGWQNNFATPDTLPCGAGLVMLLQ